MAGETVTAAIGNTHWRDNFLQTAPAIVTTAGDTIWATAANALTRVPARIYKSADEIVNNSTTLQNDDHLVLPIAANEIWAIQMRLFITNATGSPGFKVAFTVPSGATGSIVAQSGAAASDLGASTNVNAMTTTITSGFAAITLASYTEAWMIINLYVINSSNAGNVQFQWAQSSAVVGNTTLLKGSHMIPTRLA